MGRVALLLLLIVFLQCVAFPGMWGLWGNVRWIILCPPSFFKVVSCLHTLTPLFKDQGSVNGGSAFPDELHVSLFPGGVPALCLDDIVNPLCLCPVKGVSHVFTGNLPPGLLAGWEGSFTCNCCNMVEARYWNETQRGKLSLEGKTLPPFPSVTEQRHLPIMSPALYHSATPIRNYKYKYINKASTTHTPGLPSTCVMKCYNYSIVLHMVHPNIWTQLYEIIFNTCKVVNLKNRVKCTTFYILFFFISLQERWWSRSNC